MKKWLLSIIISAVVFFSCKKADIDKDTFTQPPQFKEFFALSSADNSKFFSSSIEIKKGESVTIIYTIIDAETLEFYENGQWFKRGPVQRFEHAAWQYPECQNSFVFKLSAKNPLGSTSNEISVIVH